MRIHVVPILERYGADLVLCGHSHSYERSCLLNGAVGQSWTLSPTMIMDAGSGRPGDTGAYLKPSTGPASQQGTVYVVAGSAGQTGGGLLNHPAMFLGLNRLGSMVLDIDGHRLEALFLGESGVVEDTFTILKGSPSEPLHIATVRLRDGRVAAQFKTTAGVRYRIERTTRMENREWDPITPDILATGATTTWSEAVGTEAVACFYRVVQVE
jgi:hypothetical protein